MAKIIVDRIKYSKNSKSDILKFSIILILITWLFANCGSRKYIKEIPYKMTYKVKVTEDVLKTNRDNVPNHVGSQSDSNSYDKVLCIKNKYAIVLESSPQEIKNYNFYGFIDQYIGTPYAQKTFCKDSLNIVLFARALYEIAYDRKIPASALGIFKSKDIELFTGRDFMEEGDIIFLRYSKDNPVSDIAIYLKNNKILASTKASGLSVFNFKDDYFQSRYLASGRMKEIKPK